MTKMNANPRDETKRVGKMDIEQIIVKFFNISANMLNHGCQRGVYCGFTGDDAQDFLQGKKDTFTRKQWSVAEITEWWKTNWARKRYANVVASGRLRSGTEFITLPAPVEAPVAVAQPPEKLEAQKTYMQNYRALGGAGEIVVQPNAEFTYDLDPGYIGGLFDGDGTISIKGDATLKTAYCSIGQCDVRILFAIQNKYGGQIRQRKKDGDATRQRAFYILTVLGVDALALITLITEHCILKQKRAQLTKEWIEKNMTNDELAAQVTSLQKDFTPYEDATYTTRLTDGYIAGLTDAEGCISTRIKNDKSVDMTFSITQVNNEHILTCIRTRYNNVGSVKNGRMNVYNKTHIATIMTSIMQHITVKKEQFEATLRICNELGLTVEQKTELSNFICNFKHSEFIVEANDITTRNVAAKQQSAASEEVLAKKEQVYQAKMAIFKKKQSERMTGEKHADPMPMEQRVDIALANITLRRTTEDETIYNVRSLIAEGKSQKDVCDELSLSRHVVHRITKGELMPIDELNAESVGAILTAKREHKTAIAGLDKDERITQAAKKSGMAKRKFTLDSMLKLFNYALEHPTVVPVKLADMSETEFGVSMTITQVKNLMLGKVHIYPDEFPYNGVTYDDYIKLQERVSEIDYTELNKVLSAIKARKLQPALIFKILRVAQGFRTTMTKHVISKKISDESMQLIGIAVAHEQCMGVLKNNTKMYECEFPCEGLTYEEYVSMM